MRLLGAIEHREAPYCPEGDRTNHLEEWDDLLLWIGQGLCTAEDHHMPHLDPGFAVAPSSCGAGRISCSARCPFLGILTMLLLFSCPRTPGEDRGWADFCPRLPDQ